MSRILYGVMGDSRGHVNRSLIIAKEMKHHEFLFVGGAHVHWLESQAYSVVDVPMVSTFYRNNRVAIPETVANALKVILGSRQVVKRLAGIIEDFNPDLILTDYEYFTPIAAKRTGRPCISLDHQHIITHSSHTAPPEQKLSRIMTSQSVKRLYSKADRHLIISFFRPPPIDPSRTEIFPPVIRRSVTKKRPVRGGHVLVYLTSPTFHELLPVLESFDRRFIIYGFRGKTSRKNLLFKRPSDREFLADLASCEYAIINGGHNVISEALYLGKPVFCFPIANAYEQFLNAYFVEQLGFGAYCMSIASAKTAINHFHANLNEYRARVQSEKFFGNDEVRARLEELIASNPQAAE